MSIFNAMEISRRWARGEVGGCLSGSGWMVVPGKVLVI